MFVLRALVVVTTTGLLANAHPGQSDASKRAEAKTRNDYLSSLEFTDLANCAPKLAAQGYVEQSIARRRAVVTQLRKRHLEETARLEKRQVKYNFEEVLKKSHKSNLNLGASYQSADWALLGQNRSTVMHPEATEGPYYVSGEFIRKNLIDNEPGMKLYLDIQIVDMNTCTPVPKAAVEIWGANATGVYSNIVGFGNGNLGDASNANNRALRGIQISNNQGAVQFETIIPGFYAGRTSHIHVMTHVNHTILPNNTIKGGSVAHVGQLYFDQQLLDEISTMPTYKANRQAPIKNVNDMLMATTSRGGYDPVIEYTMIGSKLEDGVFGWINYGVNAKSKRQVFAAAHCAEGGCKSFDLMSLFTPANIGEIIGGLGDMISGFLGGGKGAPKGPPKGAAMPKFDMFPTEMPKGFVPAANPFPGFGAPPPAPKAI